MLPIILSIILIIAMIFSIMTVVRRRKKAAITGIKSALTSICFYLLAVNNLLAYWFDFLGLISWSVSVVLLILGGYFMKYMPVAEK